MSAPRDSQRMFYIDQTYQNVFWKPNLFYTYIRSTKHMYIKWEGLYLNEKNYVSALNFS